MTKPNPNDISIGEDKWITSVDLTGRSYDRDVSIDPLILPMESFWSALEVNCIADCCGIDAFSFWPEDIEAACRSHDRQAITSAFESLREFVEKSSAETFFNSRRLNDGFDKQVFLQLIEHILRHV